MVEVVMLTILLLVGVEVVDDLLHTLEGEVNGIDSENSPPIHVVWMMSVPRPERLNDSWYLCLSTWSPGESWLRSSS